MGRAELTLALKQKGESEARAIWTQAEAEAERYRQQKEQEAAGKRQHCSRQAEESSLEECRHVEWRVAKRVRRIRLQALQEIALRLEEIARAELPEFVAERRALLLSEAAASLPAAEWAQVTVHPHDVPQARKLFPGKRIATDDAITAGLIVATEAEAVRVDDSLLRRLERIWPELVGRMLAELEVARDA